MTDSSVIVDGSTGQIACNSYELYQRDIEMLQSLNVNLAKIFKFLQLLEKNYNYSIRQHTTGSRSLGRGFCQMELDQSINPASITINV